jgi:hypothetical protein
MLPSSRSIWWWLLYGLLLSAAFSFGALKEHKPRASLVLSMEAPPARVIVFRVLLTNKSRGPRVDASKFGRLAGPDDLAWTTCPGPLTVVITTKNGAPVRPKTPYNPNPTPAELPLCSRNVFEKLEPGETATFLIPISDLADFRTPGVYTIRFRGAFRDTIGPGGAVMPNVVFSNPLRVTIAP